MFERLWTLHLKSDDTPGGGDADPGAAESAGTPGTQTAEAPDWANPPELPFTLDSIEDADQRSFLQARQAQLQAGFTKAVQRVQEYEGTVKPLMELRERLADPEQREQALAELAAEFDIELDFGDDAQGTEPGDEPPAAAEGDDVAALRARIEQLESAEGQRTEEQKRAAFLEHVDASLLRFARDEGHSSIAELPDLDREGILAHALAMPRMENGLLDMESATNRYIIQRDAIREAERERIRAAKDVPTPDLSSESADPAPPIGDRASRLERAAAIAGRHV